MRGELGHTITRSKFLRANNIGSVFHPDKANFKTCPGTADLVVSNPSGNLICIEPHPS